MIVLEEFYFKSVCIYISSQTHRPKSHSPDGQIKVIKI